MIDRFRKYIVDDEFRLIYYSNMLYIVNFIKILDLNNKELTIKDKDKLFLIKGNNLTLKRLLNKEILVMGNIKNIEVLYDK